MSEASTFLYFVRHAESRYVEGQERERGLTEQVIKMQERLPVCSTGSRFSCSILALTGER